VILITAFGDEATHAEARRLGAAATIDKPFEIEVLLSKAEELLGC
jgi:DNA-binding response OmpR family regulator